MAELSSEPGKVSGIKIKLGGQDYIVPPLNIEAVERYEADIERVQTDRSLKLKPKMELICNIVLAAIQRNYPETELVFLKKWLDMRNVREVFEAVLGQSGFDEAKPGEGKAGA